MQSQIKIENVVMKKIVVTVCLGLLALTLPPLTHAGIASSLLDESCFLKMRDDTAAQSGLPADQIISCGNSVVGSVIAARLRPAADVKQQLLQSYAASRSAATNRQRMNCKTEDAQSLNELGLPHAVGIACKMKSGGWPQLVILIAKKELLFVAEGSPASLPALLSAADPDSKSLSRADYIQALQKLFGKTVPLASANEIAGFKSTLQNARSANAQGKYKEAESQFRSALDLQTKLLNPNDAAIAETLMDLALNVSNQGRDEEAIALFRRAEPIVQASSRDADRARFVAYQAYNAANASRFDEALKYASGAVAAWRKIATGQGQFVFSLDGSEAAFDPLMMEKGELALALNLQANMALRLEELGLAQIAASESLGLMNDTRGLPKWWRADVLLTLGKISSVQGRLSAAEQYLNAALTESKQAFGEGPRLLPIYAALAKAYQREGMSTSSIVTFRDIFKRIRALPPAAENPLTKEDLIPFGMAVTAYAEKLTDDTQKQGLYNEAFDAFGLLRPELVEQTVARASARLAVSDPALAKLVEALQRAERERDTTNLELSAETSLADEQRSKLVEDKLIQKKSAAEKESQRLQSELATKFPEYVALSAPKALDTVALRERLGVKEGVVSFIIGREVSFVQLVRRDGIWIGRIAEGQESLAESVSALRKAMDVQSGSVGEFDIALAHQLYQRLFGSIKNKLTDLDHLVVVPAGPLASLPFSLLVETAPTNQRYADASWLIKRLAISNEPSLRSFYLQRTTTAQTQPTKSLLAFGNPRLQGKSEKKASSSTLSALATSCRQDGPASGDLIRSLAPLPETEDELKVVNRVLSAKNKNGSVVHTSDAATEDKLRSESLGDYRVLYFATHGLLPGELKCQAEPALVLTPPSSPVSRANDGLLEASEIASLRLNADLVVLSACNTAGSAGKFGGDALSGLAESFFYAGARSLVVSHWQVSSKATAELMSGMFEALGPDLTGGAARSLQTSQLKLIKQEKTAHPLFWAAFVIVGDGREDSLLPLPRSARPRS
jgi:CHAT domain-containing protein